jgi:DNA-damage-inducible protein J
LRAAVHEKRISHPFTIDAWHLLPEHMYCTWTLPRESSDFSMRWNLIKAGFSRRAKSFCHVDEWMNDSKRKRRETTFGQRRFRKHLIRDEQDYERYECASLTMAKSRWQIFAWPVLTPPLPCATM